MIRVLHIVPSMNRGGVETTLMNIFRNIDRQKIRFDFLLETDEECSYNNEIRSLGGKIYSITPRRKSLFENIKTLDEFFKEHIEYKIIHMHVSSLTYVKPLKIAKRYKVPVRIIHSRNSKEGGSRLHKYLHTFNQINVKSYATDYFACSDLAAKWLFGKKQYNAGEYKIINNGIQTDKFIYNESKRDKIRKELNIEHKLVIGNVGRFHPQKNHLYLLDIFKEIKKDNPNARLLLVGDGFTRKLIEEKTEKLGLRESVLLTGVRSDVPELLQAMDVFVMPSFHEGLPGTVVEAQGAGLPCIISDTITKQVAITNLVKFNSIKNTPKQWSKLIVDVVEKYKRRNTQLELINAGFDMQTISKKMQDFYIRNFIEI